MKRSMFDQEVSTEEYTKASAPAKPEYERTEYLGPPYLDNNVVKIYKPVISQWVKPEGGGAETLEKKLNQFRFIANLDNYTFNKSGRMHYLGPKYRIPVPCLKNIGKDCCVCALGSKWWKAVPKDAEKDSPIRQAAVKLFAQDVWFTWGDPRDHEDYQDPKFFPITAGANVESIMELMKNKDGQITKSVTHTKNGYDILFYKYTDSADTKMPKLHSIKLDDDKTPLHTNDEYVERMCQFVYDHPFYDRKNDDGSITPGVIKFLSDEQMMELAMAPTNKRDDDDVPPGDDGEPQVKLSVTNDEKPAAKPLEKPQSAAQATTTPAEPVVQPAGNVTPEKMAEMKAKIASLQK